MNLVCPIDNKDDAIQKVSAVVASGQSTGTFSGPTGGTVSYDGKLGSVSGHTTLSGSTISQLAILLAPPPKPQPESYSCLLTLLAYFFAFMGGVAVLSLPVMCVIIFPMFLGMGGMTFDSSSEPNVLSSIAGLIPALMFGVFYVLVYGAMLWGAFKIFRARKKHISKENERVSLEEPIWGRAMEKWHQLYYCHKHDIVFDPENGEYCEPASLKEFVYKSLGGG